VSSRDLDVATARRHYILLMFLLRCGCDVLRYACLTVCLFYLYLFSKRRSLKTFWTEFWTFYHKGVIFPKKRKKCSQNFQVLRLQAVITTQWLQITGYSLPNWPFTRCLVSANVNSRSRSLYAIAVPSVVCLSVTFVHPTQPVEIFDNYSSPFGTFAILWHPRKILRRSS